MKVIIFLHFLFTCCLCVLLLAPIKFFYEYGNCIPVVNIRVSSDAASYSLEWDFKLFMVHFSINGYIVYCCYYCDHVSDEAEYTCM